MPPALFVLRHGRSLANERGLIASSLATAGSAYGLTDEGRAQLRATLEDAREVLRPPVSILSSPLLRARETAEIAADFCATRLRADDDADDAADDSLQLGDRVTVDDRLIERSFGDLELESDDRYESVWEIDRRDPSHRTWNVESVIDVLVRLRALTDDLRDRPDGSVILVTHGDVASTLLCAASGSPMSRHREVGGLATGQLRALDWPPAAQPPIFDRDS